MNFAMRNLFIVTMGLLSLALCSCGGSSSGGAPVAGEAGEAVQPELVFDDTATTFEDQAVWISLLDNDQVGVGIVFESISVQPNNGFLTLGGEGRVRYTPSADFSGTDSFRYSAVSGSGVVQEAEVVITIISLNDPPVAEDDSVVTIRNQPVVVYPLENDSDVDSSAIFLLPLEHAENGIVRQIDFNSFSYHPLAYFTGTEVIEYTIRDNFGALAYGQVVVEVEEAPIEMVGNDQFYVKSGEFTLLDVLENDPLMGSSADLNTIISVTQPAEGSVYIQPGGNLLVYQAASEPSMQEISYMIDAGAGPLSTPPQPFTVNIVVSDLLFSGTDLVADFLGLTGQGNFAVPLFVEWQTADNQPLGFDAMVFSVAYEAEKLTTLFFELDPFIGESNDGDGPEVLLIEHYSGGLTVSAVFSLAGTEPLEFSGRQSLGIIGLETASQWWQQHPLGGVVELDWGVHNYLALHDGEILTGTTSSSEITLEPTAFEPGLHLYSPPQTVPYLFSTGEASFEQSIYLIQGPVDGIPDATGGLSFGVTYENDMVSVNSIDPGLGLQQLQGGAGPEFFSVFDYGNGFTLGVVYMYDGSSEFAEEGAYELLAVNYQAEPSALLGSTGPQVTTFTFVGNLGDPPVPVLLSIGGQSYQPATKKLSPVTFLPL